LGRFLWAEFEDTQLERYGSWILAQDASKKVLVVFVPEARVPEANWQLARLQPELCKVVVTWEEFGKHLHDVSAIQELKFVFEEWLALLDYLCGTYDWSRVQSAYSDQFAMKLLLEASPQLFVDDRYQMIDRQLGKGSRTYGYSLFEKKKWSSCNAWFGLVRSSEFVSLDYVERGEQDTFLITLAMDMQISNEMDALADNGIRFGKNPAIKHRKFNDDGYWTLYPNCVTIHPEEGGSCLRSFEDWRRLLEPFRDAVAKMSGRG
jgi:hypothetical protein